MGHALLAKDFTFGRVPVTGRLVTLLKVLLCLPPLPPPPPPLADAMPIMAANATVALRMKSNARRDVGIVRWRIEEERRQTGDREGLPSTGAQWRRRSCANHKTSTSPVKGGHHRLDDAGSAILLTLDAPTQKPTSARSGWPLKRLARLHPNSQPLGIWP